MERRYLSDKALVSMDFSKDVNLENGTSLSDIEVNWYNLDDGTVKYFYELPCIFTRELAELYLDENDGYHEKQLIRYMKNKNPSKDEIVDYLNGLLFDLTLTVHDDGEIDLYFENHSNFGCDSLEVRLVGENVPKLFDILKEFIAKYNGSFEEYKGYTIEFDDNKAIRSRSNSIVPFSYKVEYLIRGNFCTIDSELKRIFVERDKLNWYENEVNGLALENRYILEHLGDFLKNIKDKDSKIKLIDRLKNAIQNGVLDDLGKLNLEPQQYLDGWED